MYFGRDEFNVGSAAPNNDDDDDNNNNNSNIHYDDTRTVPEPSLSVVVFGTMVVIAVAWITCKRYKRHRTCVSASSDVDDALLPPAPTDA